MVMMGELIHCVDGSICLYAMGISIYSVEVDGLIMVVHFRCSCSPVDDRGCRPLVMVIRIVFPSVIMISLSNVPCKCWQHTFNVWMSFGLMKSWSTKSMRCRSCRHCGLMQYVVWVRIVALLSFKILHRLGIHCSWDSCGSFVYVSSRIGTLVLATCCAHARAMHANCDSEHVLQSDVKKAFMHEMEYST